ncbi:MAG: hypothetical protein ACRCZC_01920, partial [Culicoidibacterales bacterium]
MQYINKIIKFSLALLLSFSVGQPLVTLAQEVGLATISEIGSSADNPIKVLKIIPGEFVRSYWSSTLGQTVELAEITKIEAP